MNPIEPIKLIIKKRSTIDSSLLSTFSCDHRLNVARNCSHCSDINWMINLLVIYRLSVVCWIQYRLKWMNYCVPTARKMAEVRTRATQAYRTHERTHRQQQERPFRWLDFSGTERPNPRETSSSRLCSSALYPLLDFDMFTFRWPLTVPKVVEIELKSTSVDVKKTLTGQ